MKIMLLLLTSLISMNASAENYGGKFVSIQCVPALGQMQVKSLTNYVTKIGNAEKATLKKQGIFVGADFAEQVGNTIDQTCQLGKSKVRVLIEYGGFGNGYCGGDPSASLQLFVDGKLVREINDNSSDYASFHEDCREGLSSISELTYNQSTLYRGVTTKSVDVLSVTVSRDEKPDQYASITYPLK